MKLRCRGGRWFLGDVRLSKRQVTLLLAVMARPRVPTSEIIEMIWPDPDDEPDSANGIVKTIAYYLRAKLHGSGWMVYAIPGERGRHCGYRLEPEAVYLERLAA